MTLALILIQFGLPQGLVCAQTEGLPRIEPRRPPGYTIPFIDLAVRGESPASTETVPAPAGQGAMREHTGSM